ncbi:MAG: hypothetical protein MR601_04160 [Erysipelotrichaceae bacterium]|nr:hypothetical protein [Erysipelotrichaceae bacterium]
MNRYQIPKRNGKIPTFIFWTWKEAIIIVLASVVNYITIGKYYEGSKEFFTSITTLPSVVAVLIIVIPDLNIRIIDIIWKYFYYIFLQCKKYKFKE